MAIDSHFARFLFECHKQGIDFHSTLTIGRLNYYLSVKETRKVLRRVALDEKKFPELLSYEQTRYAETFFEALGAAHVDSMDASDFEGATIVHDLNHPVPEKLKNTFDVVCDGGTIEHVFNFPAVIRNCMEMVKVGGCLILNCPANNLFGHGFYQFSPELWFRLLNPVNGFETKRVVAVEYGLFPKNFEVADPADVKERVVMTNRYPVVLHVLARKIAAKPILESFPQQSDYVPRWAGAGDSASKRKALEIKLRRSILELMPGLARALENFHRISRLNKRESLANSKFFKKLAD